MVAEIHQLKTKPIAVDWMCSTCGIDAACNCGAPLMSKASRVREAIDGDPTKPNKQIARETGADPKQVRREREKLRGDMSPPDMPDETTWPNAFRAALVEDDIADPRIDNDGKLRRLPRRTVIPEEFDEDLAFAQSKDAFMARAAEAAADARYNGLIDNEVIEAAQETAAAWCQLVSLLQGEVK